MSVVNQNQLASPSGRKQKKPRSVLEYCNNILSRVKSSSSSSSSSSKPPAMLRTDAVPPGNELQPSRFQSNGVEHISPPQFAIIPSNNFPVPAHLMQNNLSQTNQNVHVNQTNLNFNGCEKLHIGGVTIFNSPDPSSRKNSIQPNNVEKTKTKSILGNLLSFRFIHYYSSKHIFSK